MAAIRAREIVPLPPPAPVPDMPYVEVDGTGVPVRPGEAEGRQGKAGDGKARTREIKLARLFTQSSRDADGKPVMDPGSSSYVATFDGKDVFADLVGAEYLRRGGDHFRQVVALGDGAAWIWTMAEELHPHASHIVDIYHAREHLTDLAAHLAFITPDPPQWLNDRLDDLDAGNIEAIITAARQYPLHAVLADELDKKLGYFKHNAHRMRYARFKSLGMFTGSGAIEAGCKAIVTQRAKQSGMRWTVDGAAGIIALRCQQASGRWGRALARPRTRHPSLSRAARSHLTDNTTHTPRPETISKITTSKSVVHPRCSRCTDAGLDPDEWFPVSTEAARARREAAAALAVCALCPVRAECQALSLRHWDIGQHGVWGGLVAADRARLRRGLAAGRGRHLFLVSGNDGAAAVWLGWWRLVMGQVVR